MLYVYGCFGEINYDDKVFFGKYANERCENLIQSWKYEMQFS